MQYWVYILRCKDDTLYTGITTDTERRLREHNSGTGAKYTSSRAPLTLVYREAQPDRSAALRREVAIKRMKREAKLQLIASAEGA